MSPTATTPSTPLAHYQRRVASGELRADRAQLVAVRHLNALYQRLCTTPKSNLFGRLLAGAKPTRWQTRHSLYLWGGVGTGKTLLMDLFYNALPENFARRKHYHRFMMWVHDERAKIKSKQDPLAIIAAQIAAEHRVLCLDEFSVTDITDAMIWANLLEHLFANRVALITTSNTHPDALYQDGLQRARFIPAIALLHAHARIVRVDGGTDYRACYLESAALYHTPHNAAAVRALQQSFANLEDGAPRNPATLVLSGRKVAALAAGSGTVWFSFDALCQGNRSKLDYIDIAKRFHTLILSDIPRLGAEHDDAARRFIELVDELYDRGVNLIVSAAAPREKLYQGKRLAPTFQRTISRLREMSSQDYLARAHR